MSTYIINTILFQLLFLILYELLLKNTTFFSWNRWYLLTTSALSLGLPFINLSIFSFWLPEGTIVQLPINWFVVEGTEGSALTGNNASPPYMVSDLRINWWFFAYLAGAGINLHLMLKKYNELSRLFRFRTVVSEIDFRIIEVPNSTIACTFLRTIFLGEKLSTAEKHHILTHELVHVKQKHSLDLIFYELLKIILWFNPLIYIIQKRITTLHEYIADEEVVKVIEKRTYYDQLLNSAFNTKNISFINQFFNHSSTRLKAFGKTITLGKPDAEVKKRIIMLQKSKTNETSKIKYLSILPLMLLMLSYVSYSGPGMENPVKKDTLDKLQKESLPFQQLDIPFAVVEQTPVYPGCEEETGAAGKDCFNTQIKNFINVGFNTAKVKPYLKEGSNRIFLVFIIDSNGEVTGIKSRMVTPGIPLEDKAEIEKEANRVALTIPKMKPGIHDGKAVGVSYSLPIEILNTGEVK